MMKSRREPVVDRSASSPDVKGKSRLSLSQMSTVRGSPGERDKAKGRVSPSPALSTNPYTGRARALNGPSAASPNSQSSTSNGRRESGQLGSSSSSSSSSSEMQVRRSNRTTATSWTARYSKVKKTASSRLPRKNSEDEGSPAPALVVGSSGGGGSENDNYCWHCHKEGEVVCCDGCPRVFHRECCQLHGEPPGEWLCPVCKAIKQSPVIENDHMREILHDVVFIMLRVPSSEMFRHPVSENEFPTYADYVCHPVTITSLLEMIDSCEIKQPIQLQYEAQWILHNCIIFNGDQHGLTQVARNMMKYCRVQVTEAELCAQCYWISLQHKDGSFPVSCGCNHKLIWAKLRGYPVWPAKVMKVIKTREGEKLDVRFFGDHSKSRVDPKNTKPIEEDPGQLPSGTQISDTWKLALQELQSYLKSEDRHIASVERFVSSTGETNSGRNSPATSAKLSTSEQKSSTAAEAPCKKTNLPVDGEVAKSNKEGSLERRDSPTWPSELLTGREEDVGRVVINYVKPADSDNQSESSDKEPLEPLMLSATKRLCSASSEDTGDDVSAEEGGPSAKRRFRIDINSLTSQALDKPRTSSSSSSPRESPMHDLEVDMTSVDSVKEDDAMLEGPLEIDIDTVETVPEEVSALSEHALSAISPISVDASVCDQSPSMADDPACTSEKQPSTTEATSSGVVDCCEARSAAIELPSESDQQQKEAGCVTEPVVRQHLPSGDSCGKDHQPKVITATVNHVQPAPNKERKPSADQMLEESCQNCQQRQEHFVAFVRKWSSDLQRVAAQLGVPSNHLICETNDTSSSTAIVTSRHSIAEDRRAQNSPTQDVQSLIRQAVEEKEKELQERFSSTLAKLRDELETEKKEAVMSAKSSLWCSACGEEATYFCCNNTNYCSVQCQEAHWPQHMDNCASAATTTSAACASPDVAVVRLVDAQSVPAGASEPAIAVNNAETPGTGNVGGLPHSLLNDTSRLLQQLNYKNLANSHSTAAAVATARSTSNWNADSGTGQSRYQPGAGTRHHTSQQAHSHSQNQLHITSPATHRLQHPQHMPLGLQSSHQSSHVGRQLQPWPAAQQQKQVVPQPQQTASPRLWAQQHQLQQGPTQPYGYQQSRASHSALSSSYLTHNHNSSAISGSSLKMSHRT